VNAAAGRSLYPRTPLPAVQLPAVSASYFDAAVHEDAVGSRQLSGDAELSDRRSIGRSNLFPISPLYQPFRACDMPKHKKSSAQTLVEPSTQGSSTSEEEEFAREWAKWFGNLSADQIPQSNPLLASNFKANAAKFAAQSSSKSTVVDKGSLGAVYRWVNLKGEPPVVWYQHQLDTAKTVEVRIEDTQPWRYIKKGAAGGGPNEANVEVEAEVRAVVYVFHSTLLSTVV
jgi:hypothetical protein